MSDTEQVLTTVIVIIRLIKISFPIIRTNVRVNVNDIFMLLLLCNFLTSMYNITF